jgi:hypothetical protein
MERIPGSITQSRWPGKKIATGPVQQHIHRAIDITIFGRI